MKQESLLKCTCQPVAVLTVALCLTLASCSKNPERSAIPEQTTDPAQANLAQAEQQAAPVAAPARPSQARPPQSRTPAQPYVAQSQTTQSYPPSNAREAPPAQEPQPYDQSAPQPNPTYNQGATSYPEDYASNEQPIAAEQPPPPLPEYTQPPCPGENYLWTPGYWSYAPAGYFWVPGAWVAAPYVGALWTPPYWAYASERYRFHHGYWGPHIGFYGGVNYGFGYGGRGYEGGYWDRNRRVFNYNRSVNNVNTTVIHNVYNYRVVNNNTTINNTRISYNGGRGGIADRPSPQELAVLHEQRIAPVPAQMEHMHQAESNRAQFVPANQGRPGILVAPRPLATAYREPAQRVSAVPEARPLPPAAAKPKDGQSPKSSAQSTIQPGQRPDHVYTSREHPEPPVHSPPPPAAPSVSGQPVTARPEFRPVAPQSGQAPGSAAEQRFESRPVPRAQTQQKFNPQSRVGTHAPVAEPRPEAQPRMEQRPMPQPRSEPPPQPRMEQHPAVQARSEPAPQPRVEQHPAPPPRAEAPQPHVEQRPQPSHPEPAAARPAPHPEHEHHD